VFLAYDHDKSKCLTIDEFTNVMRRLDPSFTEEEIKIIFEVVDLDKSNTIEFEELEEYYKLINGI
jgi:Ca2+-binding EF-hand superfamily protein